MSTGQDAVPEGMVRIPGGTFTMGANGGYVEEAPAHPVTVGPFLMDTCPVTNAEYKAFCDATNHPWPTPPRWPGMPQYFERFPEHPAVNIGYADATAYAAWRGKRLPTEAEWEFAARGGVQDAPYPWGEGEPGGAQAAFATRDTPVPWRDPMVATGHSHTAPVGSFPANPYGLFDMAGNVWEWCDNWFYRYPWEELDERLVGEGWGLQRVVRGGAWYSPARDLRVARRLRVHGGVGSNGTGFRCVQDIGEHAMPTAPQLPPVPVPDPHQWDDLIMARPQRMERGVELCLGCGPDLTESDAARIRALGFTSVEQYVHWGTVENDGEGVFDFSQWDEQVAILDRHNLKWVPFLIAGPAYSLPDWFRDSADHRGAVCLEHRLPSKIQSVSDRSFDRHIARFVDAFADHYRDRGVIEALLLGITGDFGEAIYPVTGTAWTQVTPGPYHTHPGYWCGDPLAETDFRNTMLRRYDGDIARLSAAWNTAFTQASEITTPNLDIPDGIEAFRADEPTSPGTFPIHAPQDRRRWLDFMAWYRGAMNALAETWMGISRRAFPEHPIYLCTGGDAPPHQGAHFGDQCRIAAHYGGGVRITNEASRYAHNFAITRWVTSAGRHHGAFTGIEPAGGVNEFGVTCRIYNAMVSGAKNLHFYAANIVHHRETVEAWQANYAHIRQQAPIVDLGVYHPDTAIMLGTVATHDVFNQVGKLRDLTDLDLIDDTMIEDGVLERIRVLVMAHAAVVEQGTLDRIAAWHESGGLLVILGDSAIESVEGTPWPVARSERVIRCGLLNQEPDQDEAIAAHLRESLSNRGYPLIDGEFDQVYVAQVEAALIVLNHGADDVTRQLTLPSGEARTVTLPRNSITEITLGT
jgi:formylglycine-generating enzyme required for sulfatase activity